MCNVLRFRSEYLIIKTISYTLILYTADIYGWYSVKDLSFAWNFFLYGKFFNNFNASCMLGCSRSRCARYRVLQEKIFKEKNNSVTYIVRLCSRTSIFKIACPGPYTKIYVSNWVLRCSRYKHCASWWLISGSYKVGRI